MSEPAPPVVPRPAASLLVLRRSPAGPEVLMGLRGAGHKFMPNRLVFPGGAVDPEDHAAPVASPLRPDILRRLAASAEPSLAMALGVAAARELVEETGLTLGEPPHLDGFDYLSRAVTPPSSPVRFDARFFVVDAAAVSGTLAGSGELEDLRYFAVAEAMALDLAVVTNGVLGKLLEWLAMAPEQRAARTRTPAMFSRVWHEE